MSPPPGFLIEVHYPPLVAGCNEPPSELPPPTSVHPHESNRQEYVYPDVPALEAGKCDDIAFRHSGWRLTRHRVACAMVAAMVHENRLLAFTGCGHDAFVARNVHDPTCHKVICNKCRDRFCKPCARARAGIVARNLLAHVHDRKLRFITLTLKTATPDLKLELNRLYDSFRKLQRRVFWKRHCWGGAAMLELKYNPGSDRWHPHLHVLVEGSYLSQSKLSAEWMAVTGDSFVVDVRAVPDNGSVVRYVTKYATDPLHPSVTKSVQLISEAIRAMKGRRACMTFGSWRSFQLTTQESDDAWEILGRLDTIRTMAAKGDADCLAILEGLWVFSEFQGKGSNDDPDPRAPPDPTLFDLPF